MSLVIRVTLLFVLVSLLVFIVGGFISFNVMMKEVDSEQKRFLIERLDRVSLIVERRNPTDTLERNRLTIIPLPALEDEKISFSDTLVMHRQLERIEPHLKLTAVKNIGNKSYLVIIYDVIIEPDDIREGLVESLVKMYLILLVAVLLVGFVVSAYMLRPFDKTLQTIRNFSIADPGPTEFPKSGIAEFKKLNRFLQEMADKVRSDYQSLKEFSENASHELQTPIAIIQGKLEVLLNSNLDEDQITQISSAQSTLRRLRNLSTSLSILTKIENKEFDKVSAIDLTAELEKILDEFRELIELKSIKLTTCIEENVTIKVDEILCELLLTNLINNAIRHNWENGTIEITLKENSLEIINSGEDLAVNPEELFKRFKKSNQASGSLGLGLAIVKKICDLYACRLEYLQERKQHHIKVSFNH